MPYIKSILGICLFYFLFTLSSCLQNGNDKAVKLNNVGLAHLNNLQYDSALVFFKNAVSQKNISMANNVNINRNIAITYAEMEWPDSAKVFYKKAAEASVKGSYDYLVNRADVEILNQNISQAITYLQSAWEINNKRVDVNNNLGLIYLGEYGEAYYNPDKALRYNLAAYSINNDRNTQFVLAKNYYQLKNYNKALKLFESLHQQFPNYSTYLISLIIVNEDAGHTKQSATLLEELKQSDPEAYQNYLAE